MWSCVLDQPALKCATGSADFTAKVWDACGGTMMHEFQHNHIVRTVNFSFDTKLLCTGGESIASRSGDRVGAVARSHTGVCDLQPPAALGARVGRQGCCEMCRVAFEAWGEGARRC